MLFHKDKVEISTSLPRTILALSHWTLFCDHDVYRKIFVLEFVEAWGQISKSRIIPGRYNLKRMVAGGELQLIPVEVTFIRCLVKAHSFVS